MLFCPKPVIYGIESYSLSCAERDFFSSARPFGFILFSRNIGSAEQLRALVFELSSYSAFGEALIFIDQEGGRVARIGGDIMLQYPSARWFGELYERDASVGLEALSLSSRSLAGELRSLGIRANCAPVCDVGSAVMHDVIGDRAFSDSADIVSVLASVQAASFLRAGVYPVLKHIPGHGRAMVDSHESLPLVSASLFDLRGVDFVPFCDLSFHLFAMTAHILFESLDVVNPVTLSSIIISDIIRGEIGFEGLLMSDDLSMGALRGDFGERALSSISSGCDLVLHCNGDMGEMVCIDSVLCDMSLDRLNVFIDFDRSCFMELEKDLWCEDWLSYRSSLEVSFGV